MKNVLMLIGGPSHPFESNGQIIKDYIESSGQYCVEMTEDHKLLNRLKNFDAVMVYTARKDLTEAQEKNLLNFVNEGGALVGIHTANVTYLDNSGYVEMLGSRFTGHGPIAEFNVEMTNSSEAIVPRVAKTFSLVDEFYNFEKTTEARLRPFMYGWWQFERKMLGYTRPYGKGRVFYSALGHDERAAGHPENLNLIYKGLRWTLREKEPTVRVGLLGYGPAFGMGGHHSGQIKSTTGLELTAVCDKDKSRREAAKEEQGEEVETFSNAKKMAESGLIDMGIVILPHAFHYEGIKTFLDAGLHVITEKPFAVRADHCHELIGLAEEKGVMLSVYHNRHWDPDILTILKILEQGTIGDVYSIECNMTGFGRPGQPWRTHKPISGGAAYDMGAHQFEKIFQIVPRHDGRGNAVNRSGMLSGNYLKKRWHDSTNEDFIRAYVKFDSGLEAQLMVSNLCAAPKPLWTILGTHGSIVIDNWGAKAKVYTQSDDGRILMTEMDQKKNEGPSYYRNMADHLLCKLPLLITPQVGMRPIQCIEGCELASAENRMIRIEFA